MAFFSHHHQRLPLISHRDKCAVRDLADPDAHRGDTQMYLYVEKSLIMAEQNHEIDRQKRGETGLT